MNYKNVFKRETKVIAFVVIALTLVVIGSSYAIFMRVKNNTDNQVVKAGSLTITYSSNNDSKVGNTNTVEGEAANCLTPMDDANGKTKGCDFKLSVTNTGTLPMTYDLLIYNNTGENNIVTLDNFKHHLTKQVYENNVNIKVDSTGAVTGTTGNPTATTISENGTLSELSGKEGATDKKVLENSIIQPGDTIVFDLKIWIKNDADVNLVGKTVSLKLDVSGLVYEGESLVNTLIGLNKTNSNNVDKFDHTAAAAIASTSGSNDLTEYRYTGATPKNYVYFGCDGPNATANKCTNENLYRIVGVIPTQDMVGGPYVPRVKIVKDTYWSDSTATTDYTGTWEESAVYTALNDTYWESLTDKYQKYIAPSVLYFGTITANGSYVPDTLYSSERADTTGVLSRIGLLYPSDYGYSLGTSAKGSAISGSNTSWLKVSSSVQEEWLLTSPGESALTLHTDGSVGTKTGTPAIRPAFYLNENVQINGGDGSSTNPYILEFR